MKKVILLLCFLVPVSLSAGPPQNPRSNRSESTRSQQELEIMKGILQTTLKFINGTASSDGGTFVRIAGRSDIEAFYLPGQGAVFVVPVPSFDNPLSSEIELLESYLQRLQDKRGISKEVADSFEERIERGGKGIYANELFREWQVLAPDVDAMMPPMPPEPPDVPDAPEAPEAPVTPSPRPLPRIYSFAREKGTALTAAEIEKRTRWARERLETKKQENSRQEADLNQKKEGLRNGLIEAILSHGDSLSNVKQAEFINLILAPGNSTLLSFANSRSKPSTILTIPKSAIADYKAGRITLDQARGKITEKESD